MSKKGKLFLNQGNVQTELLRSPAVMKIVEEKAAQMVSAAESISGIAGGYAYEVRPYGSTRQAADVQTVTPHAYYENFKNNTLLKAKGRIHD